MSRHRVKAVAVDDDYLDDEDDYEDGYGGGGDEKDGDGLTAYDKEQLRSGTIEVRKQLGTDHEFTDAEIQESLWHYYYDVGKAVTYLKNKRKTEEQKKSKQVIDGRGQTMISNPVRMLATGGVLPPISLPVPKDFFQDCPWLQVPTNRLAVIEPLPSSITHRGGLLGGASTEGKMSKLAALAAKRRQKENEKSDTLPKSENLDQSSYIASLEKLKLNTSNHKTPKRPSNSGKRPSATKPVEASIPKQDLARPKPDPSGQEASPGPHTLEGSLDDLPPTAATAPAQPSAFASILTGTPDQRRRRGHLAEDHSRDSNIYSVFQTIHTNAFDFTEPSPDDVVSNAQKSKENKTSKAVAKQAGTSKAQTSLTQGLGQLSVSQEVKSRSKGLDAVAEYRKKERKPTANFVVIGHVDAGKSTLMGRLLLDLKAVGSQVIEKYRREAQKIGKGSFALAWVLDQGSEERARGVTIDIATKTFETEKTAFTILDAPGHQDFVPNMIAGASQADFAVLVIDASTGNFESGLKGQTKEHALLVRSLGVQRLIVAVNKMDMAQWSQERFEEIRQQMTAFLASAGFRKQSIAFVPCSGLEGDNVLRKTVVPDAAWYTGMTLVEELEKSEPSTHAMEKPLRLSIADIFHGGAQNPLSVSGRMESGSLQVGEVVKIMPSGEDARIKGIQIDEESSDWAVAGQNVVIYLAEIDPIHIKSGDVLCSKSEPLTNISSFTAKLLAFDHLMPMHLDVHKGRLHVPARISQLMAILDKSSGSIIKKKPKIAQPGNLVRVRVELERPIPLEAPSRVILRTQGQTVAAGLLEES